MFLTDRSETSQLGQFLLLMIYSLGMYEVGKPARGSEPSPCL